MNPIILVTFFAIGASANSYNYGQAQPQISVRVEEAPRSSYSVQQPQRQPLYSSAPSRLQENTGNFLNQPVRQQIPILRFNQQIRGGLSDNVEFETGNGIRSSMNTRVVPGNSEFVDEEGRLVQTNSELEQSGHSYHEAPEGMHIALTWKADKNGFQPTGDHLPQPVPMPAEHAEAHRQALATAAASSGTSYSSYAAPAQQQPAIRVESYSAPQQPAVRVESYSAPQQPAVRVQSYSAPAQVVRSGY